MVGASPASSREQRFEPGADRRPAAPRRNPPPPRPARPVRRAAPTAPRTAARLPRRAPRPGGRSACSQPSSTAARRASTTGSGSSSTVSMIPRSPISPSSRGGAASICAAKSRSKRDDLRQHLAVDPNRRRHGPVDRQVRRDVAAAAEPGQRGAQLPVPVASNPGGSRSRRSSERLLTLFSSQTQEIPSASPSARANPVMLETPTAASLPLPAAVIAAARRANNGGDAAVSGRACQARAAARARWPATARLAAAGAARGDASWPAAAIRCGTARRGIRRSRAGETARRFSASAGRCRGGIARRCGSDRPGSWQRRGRRCRRRRNRDPAVRSGRIAARSEARPGLAIGPGGSPLT